MKRFYRGIEYIAQTSTLDAVETSVSGTYRGATFRFKKIAPSGIPDSVLPLTYRGVLYLGIR
jgi:hypothetical protein